MSKINCEEKVDKAWTSGGHDIGPYLSPQNKLRLERKQLVLLSYLYLVQEFLFELENAMIIFLILI